MSKLIIKGKASLKSWELHFNDQDLDLKVLDFLQTHKFPIASSCSGQGKCLKCLTSEGSLTCQMKLKDYKEQTIYFDYL
jgi:ferredoxin